MDKVKTTKRSLDLPDDLYEQIMEYAHKTKIYKFTPALIELIKKGLTDGRD